MKAKLPDKLEAARVRSGRYASDASYGGCGAFDMQGPCGERLHIIASDGSDPDVEGWEHVSVSIGRRVPNWLEMSFVKDLFWDEEECVVEFHVPKSEYINNHPHCLHLWKWKGGEFPRPPSILVGDKRLSQQEMERLAKGRP